ncbi:hypothetical protein [Ensifer adhaerens]|uniref:hypothetical protein n=1 Tax=Ensifer adhaerens TaxID=106592 RepID=UPI003D074337
MTYTKLTRDGKLRHASFKGLREPADNVDVFELKKEAPAEGAEYARGLGAIDDN